MARGRSPWVWGGAALIIGFLPFDQVRLLSVAPVLYLMFFVRPTDLASKRPRRDTCPKCASPHSPRQNFCIKCGWDLSREYSPETSDTVLASEMHQPSASSAATMERPSEAPAESAVSPPSEKPAEPVSETTESSQYTPEVAPQPVAAPPPEDSRGEGPVAEPAAPEGEPEPAPRPWGLPTPGPAPTAATMTERGAVLLSEGKLQEAIDQFTKAIALDPKHREAFERRAEAYTQQGRGERAEEDYRQIQVLNAGS